MYDEKKNQLKINHYKSSNVYSDVVRFVSVENIIKLIGFYPSTRYNIYIYIIYNSTTYPQLAITVKVIHIYIDCT